MGDSFLTTFAYSKINLALAVTGKRDDGYHELQSVMQSAGLYDIVKVRRKGRELICSCGKLSGPKNLAYKAADLFLKRLGVVDGIEITIEKRIPIQAGLAGGSSDAAAVLRVLNILYDKPFSFSQLREIAELCGADVAFCLAGGTMWAAGIGEYLEPLPPAPQMSIVIAKPPRGVNTAEAYRLFDDKGSSSNLNKNHWTEALQKGRVESLIPLLANDLEQVSIQLVPEVAALKQTMLDTGCLGALMSGSGSAVFGIAKDKQHAQEVVNELRKPGFMKVWHTKLVNQSEVESVW